MDEVTSMELSPPRRATKKRTRDDELDESGYNLRPIKRPALDLTSGVAVDVETIGDPQNLRLMTETARRSSWIFNDDWVNRTKGLRLDSPLPTSMTEDRPFQLHPPSGHNTTQQSHGPRPLSNPPNPYENSLGRPLDFDFNNNPTSSSNLLDRHSQSNLLQLRTEPNETFTGGFEEDADMVSPTSVVSSPHRKRVFMGYREDCEKCRSAVPGHYIHYL